MLDAFLSSEEVPRSALLPSELDGFLTGLAVGPERIMPAEWLPHVWGGDRPGNPRLLAAVGLQTRRLKAGRNDACPCGSGRKHKRCCGAC
ncbi:YecA/YgfB family protein [Caulobacter endophyticus]|uniref:YecA family protein n=1 Tax=Caulobacter endophyticus TaxID=2172652 RepID=A0A2T9KDD9_9CAUL|nr:hypothetical protein DDF67_01040 [Caulobacter endophyticus]